VKGNAMLHDQDLTKELWNEEEAEGYDNETFHHLLMEQYKLSVEMADRLNARRSLVNTFFLTLHAITVGIVGLSLIHSPTVQQFGLLLIPLMGLLILCYAWWRLAQWYRHQVDAKALVINALERRLPSNPFRTTDFKISQRRGGHAKNPLSRLEVYLPFFFALLYVMAVVYVVLITHYA
jgi:hypothetical protein